MSDMTTGNQGGQGLSRFVGAMNFKQTLLKVSPGKTCIRRAIIFSKMKILQNCEKEIQMHLLLQHPVHNCIQTWHLHVALFMYGKCNCVRMISLSQY